MNNKKAVHPAIELASHLNLVFDRNSSYKKRKQIRLQPKGTRSKKNRGDKQMINTVEEKPTMLGRWENLDERRDAFVTVITKVLADSEYRDKCLKDDKFARQAFIDAGVEVPADVKVVFVKEGDLEDAQLRQGGSAIIEIPPAGTDPQDKGTLQYFRGTYVHW
jgi:hypothetical protein